MAHIRKEMWERIREQKAQKLLAELDARDQVQADRLNKTHAAKIRALLRLKKSIEILVKKERELSDVLREIAGPGRDARERDRGPIVFDFDGCSNSPHFRSRYGYGDSWIYNDTPEMKKFKQDFDKLMFDVELEDNVNAKALIEAFLK